MSVSAPHRELAESATELRAAADARPVMRAMDRAVKGELRQEFATGEGPYGPWQPTVRGRQPLLSKKLPQAFRSRIEGGELQFAGKSTRDLLTGHQLGHTFLSRQVAAGNINRFNRKGRLVKAKRFEKLKRGHATLVRAHTVGARVLPVRKIVPEGSILPSKWEDLLEVSTAPVVLAGIEKAVK